MTSQKLIFLDSRDLIDCVERGVPCNHDYLRQQLLSKNAVLVYTFTNVMESIPRGRPLHEQHELLRRIEALPHILVKHGLISTCEFEEAAATFPTGRPLGRLPVASTFWRIFPGVPPKDDRDDPNLQFIHAYFDQLSLAEQLTLALTDRTSFDFSPIHRDALELILESHRETLSTAEPSKILFRNAVKQQLMGVNLAVDNLEGFTRWLFRDPTLCPGWRLAHETFQELRRDISVKLTNSDVPDFSHVYLIPYVALATLDGQWRSYCERAARRLRRLRVAIDYDSRIVRNTSAVLNELAEMPNA